MAENRDIDVQELRKQYEENPNINILNKLYTHFYENKNKEATYQIALEGIKYNDGFYYYIVGKRLLENYEKEDNLNKAIECFEKSSELGNDFAFAMLSDIYYYNEYNKKDYEKSLKYILEYDKRKGVVSNKRIGRLYYNMHEYERALNYLLEAVAEDKRLNLFIGYIYHNESTALCNYRLAIEYYHKAIEYDDNATAYNNLAIMYMNGLGIEKDEKKAFEYMLKAHEKGSDLATANLANFYRSGIGCEVDHKKAFELLNEVKDKENNVYYLQQLFAIQKDNKEYDKAIETCKKGIKIGDKYLKLLLINLYKKIYDKEIIYSDQTITKEKIYELCNELYQEGIELTKTDKYKEKFLENSLLNYSRDFINERRKVTDSKAYAFSKMVGNKNFADIYKEINIDEWYYRAVLGYVIFNELDNKPDRHNYILNQSNISYSNIDYMIGRKYEIGYKVEVNLKNAFKYYEKAISNGHPMAYSRLAYFYEKGIYVEKDIRKAKEYHTIASNDALIGDTSINTYSKEHRGVVDSQLALARIEEEDADRVNNAYLNSSENPSSYFQMSDYNKKAIYRNVIDRYSYAYSSGTITSKIAYLEFYLKNRDLYSGENLDELIEEAKDKLNTITFLKYYKEKNEEETVEKIKNNILNTNDYSSIKELLLIEESEKNDISKILLRLASLGDEEAFYRFKLLKLEKDSSEYKKVIYEMADQNVYNALIQVLEYEKDNIVYLHKVLDDTRIKSHLDVSQKYRPILGEIHFSNHEYKEASKYLLDQDKKEISLYLADENIDDSYLKPFLDKVKNLTTSVSKTRNKNFELLSNELNEYMKFYNDQSKGKEYYNT